MGNMTLCVLNFNDMLIKIIISWFWIETETKVERMQAMLSEMHIPSITKLHRSMSSGQAVIIEGSSI